MELKDYRDQLDAIDTQLLTLFQERMAIVQQVADYKKTHEIPILASGREQEILERVRQNSSEELAPYAQTLFETLLSVSRAYQKTLL